MFTNFMNSEGGDMAGPQKDIIIRHLDTVGDESGTEDMAVDGSGTPVRFKIKPAPGEIYRIARIIWTLRDTGSMDSGGWGNNGGTPLPVGLELGIRRSGVDIPLFNQTITSHVDLAMLAYDISYNSWGAGDTFLTSRMTFTKAGQYIRLEGDNNDELYIDVQDDLTYLVQQHIVAQGYIELAV